MVADVRKPAATPLVEAGRRMLFTPEVESEAGLGVLVSVEGAVPLGATPPAVVVSSSNGAKYAPSVESATHTILSSNHERVLCACRKNVLQIERAVITSLDALQINQEELVRKLPLTLQFEHGVEHHVMKEICQRQHVRQSRSRADTYPDK